MPPPTLRDIKKVYRAVALQCHPDKVAAAATESERNSAQRRFDAATDAHDRVKEALERRSSAAEAAGVKKATRRAARRAARKARERA